MGGAQRAPVLNATAVLAMAADFRDAMIRQHLGCKPAAWVSQSASL
jgi:hypothetical protein